MKSIKKLLALSLVLVSAVPLGARCEGVTVTLDGRALDFDVPPRIIDGRTLVPMRAIFEAMGAEVDWNGQTQTVTASKYGDEEYTVVTMQIGNSVFTVMNDLIAANSYSFAQTKNIELDVPPQIINDRTLVPARAVAESFGAEVDWDSQTQTVIIKSAVSAPVPTEMPVPAETSAPTDTPVPALETSVDAEQKNAPIEYDESLEPTVGYMKNFRILSAAKNSDGSYDITYCLQTYLEGRGDVAVAFECLDSSGKVVDSWSGLYHGTDYTWSDHTASATISGATVKIRLKP